LRCHDQNLLTAMDGGTNSAAVQHCERCPINGLTYIARRIDVNVRVVDPGSYGAGGQRSRVKYG
jgi:hypothetical protein